ncbi:TB2/DP1, HVA22 family-domain-containing protein [Mycena pura]|uniref:Protein YOP1 n=1 Tax=Mycena pura TaxID=153505 RepID=A0AAD6VLE7_9AGAR|nr:TB2/DP1, HVA22 family-domain-containing protein [Mycena pura]
MLFYFTSRIISGVAAFLYPGYASYKTLSQRPASEEELERWLMYWTVLGCIVGVEYIAEWAVCWIPLYYTLKTLFLLYLALPQTRGATHVYTTLLSPFFATHEREIDSALAQLRAYVYALVQTQLRLLWAHVAGAAGAGTPPMEPAVPPPAQNGSGSGLAGAVGSLWQAYGPGILAGGAALLRSAAPASPPYPQSQQRAAAAAAPTGSHNGTAQAIFERRRQLEAELAALSAVPMPIPEPSGASPSTTVSSSFSRRSSGSSGEQQLQQRGGPRERADSGRFRFEEVEVPSDGEGYDVRGEGAAAGERPPVQARGSWFGWSGSRQGYERVKSD